MDACTVIAPLTLPLLDNAYAAQAAPIPADRPLQSLGPGRGISTG